MPGPSLQVNLGAQSNGTGSITPAYPTNTQRGTLCFLMCNSAYNETVTLTDAQGFVLLGAANSTDTTSTGCRATVFWKIAEGTEPGRALGDAMTAPTIADPGDHIVARIINYTNFRPGTPIALTATEGFASTAANTNISLAGMTTDEGANEIIYFVADGNDSAASRSVTYVAGTNAGAVEGNDFTTGTTDGTGGGINFAASNVNPAATVGTATWKSTLGPAGYAAVKVIVRCPVIRYVTTSTTSGTGDVAAAIPSHGADDLLVLVVETANESVTTPTSWTLIGSVTNGTAGSGTAQYLYWLRDATAALTTVTVTDPGDHAFCKVHRFPGVKKTGNPINGFATGTGSGSSVTFPDLTTTVDQCQILYGISNIDSSAGGPTISSTPATPYVNTNNTTTGPTAIHMRNSSGGTTGSIAGGLSLGVASQEKAGALGTTTVPVDATGSSNTYYTLALEPDIVHADTPVTLDALTLAGTGAVKVQATSSVTLGAVTLASTAQVIVAGTAAITLAALTLASTGTNLTHGAAAITLGAITIATTGGPIVQAALAATLGALTLATTGGPVVHAAAAITLAALTCAADGHVFTPVQAAITLESIGMLATAIHRNRGDAAITLGDLQGTETGVVRVHAEALITLAGIGLAFTSSANVHAAAALQLEALTMSAAAQAITHGAAPITLDGLTFTATGKVANNGAAAVALGAMAIAAIAQNVQHLSATITLADLGFAAQGMVANRGALATQLAALTLSSSGIATATGRVFCTLESIIPTITVVARARGTAALQLGALAASSAGKVSNHAALARTLGALTLLGRGELHTGQAQLAVTLEGLRTRIMGVVRSDEDSPDAVTVIIRR